MLSNRRNWLKQMGLGALSISVSRLNGFASAPPAYIPRYNLADGQSVRLSSNENPYGPSPMARAAMSEYITASNRYSWQLGPDLITALAQKNNLTADHIILGAGSTQVLDLASRLAALNKGSFVMSFPTYPYWSATLENLGMKKISVPLTADKKNDLSAILKAIQPDTQLVYLCNPNNPTGTICNHEELVHFVEEASKKAWVLVDEAYIDFTSERSLSSLVNENKKLVIARTFSKIYGLAGARIGYAMAHPATIEQLSRMQSWPNGDISVVSTAAAIASLKDEKFVKETHALNQHARRYTIEQMERLNIPCIPSHTNFIYFSLANHQPDFFEQLKQNNILGTGIYEEQGKWSRITVGTLPEMQKLISAIDTAHA
ncbi:histidinol-phosphate transaminase [Asinibacterium sp. OR53]|jgi:histidinol-phosphate aminotransferase|uniref:histidinol-phosphate transaminase n=1 Tax=Asinibacterium sp. OR53 TaxID=925409 RepID=UPI0004B4CE8A|nr:histidinol-phosphate transaminase [Asinibacterium sp. OR53]